MPFLGCSIERTTALHIRCQASVRINNVAGIIQLPLFFPHKTPENTAISINFFRFFLIPGQSYAFTPFLLLCFSEGLPYDIREISQKKISQKVILEILIYVSKFPDLLRDLRISFFLFRILPPYDKMYFPIIPFFLSLLWQSYLRLSISRTRKQIQQGLLFWDAPNASLSFWPQ